jgi:hypothetical protein
MKTGTMLIGLGVVGLGVFGVVALSKKAAAQPLPAPPPGPGLLPTPPSPPAVGPSVPGPSGGGGLVFATDASSVHLRQGQYYRGRLNLGAGLLGLLPPFNASATEEDIGKGLAALGLQDIRVYMKTSDLPSDWPQETTMNASPGTRWFQGQWGGSTATVPKPSQVEQVWVTSSPALVTARAVQAAATSGLGAVMSG